MDDYDRRLAQAQDWAAGWQRRALSAETERDRLRESARLANIAADAAAEAVGNMAEKCSALLAERDRLRAIVDALLLFADHAEDCAVEVGYPCNCGLDRIHAQLDGSAEATDG